jgi:ESAT-6 family protein
MAGYKTGAAELIQAGQRMEDTNEQLQAALQQVMNEVENIRGAWKGSAASAFQNLMETYARDAKDLNDNLNKISEAIAGSAQAYQRQEEESAQSVNSIMGMLNG